MRRIGALVFPGFETLDLFGPIEMFGTLPDDYSLHIVGETAASGASRHGQTLAVDVPLESAEAFDIVLVPGGPGTRTQMKNPAVLDWLRRQDGKASMMASVCTGSAMLARSGILDGRRATSNKMELGWISARSPAVDWVSEARWVEDGRYWTSSGVSAGIDMSLAIIERQHGQKVADDVSKITEYIRHRDPTNDPFATARSKGA